jgi:hypothetical protein
MANAEDRIPEILKRVAALQNDGSAKECVALLRDIASAEDASLTSFGAGLGPTNRESLLFSAVLALSSQMIDASTDPLPSDPAWLRLILDDETDGEGIEIALASRDPVIRLAAILKIRKEAVLSDKVIASLTMIAASDPYLQIQRQTVPGEDGRPPRPGLNENVIVAPLRQLADRELNARGIGNIKKSPPTDNEASKWISEMDTREGITLEDIRFAITQLSGKGPRMKALKEAAVAKDAARMEQLRNQFRGVTPDE